MVCRDTVCAVALVSTAALHVSFILNLVPTQELQTKYISRSLFLLFPRPLFLNAYPFLFVKARSDVMTPLAPLVYLSALLPCCAFYCSTPKHDLWSISTVCSVTATKPPPLPPLSFFPFFISWPLSLTSAMFEICLQSVTVKTLRSSFFWRCSFHVQTCKLDLCSILNILYVHNFS